MGTLHMFIWNSTWKYWTGFWGYAALRVTTRYKRRMRTVLGNQRKALLAPMAHTLMLASALLIAHRHVVE